MRAARQENQVYSAEEKRALAMCAQQEHLVAVLVFRANGEEKLCRNGQVQLRREGQPRSYACGRTAGTTGETTKGAHGSHGWSHTQLPQLLLHSEAIASAVGDGLTLDQKPGTRKAHSTFGCFQPDMSRFNSTGEQKKFI